MGAVEDLQHDVREGLERMIESGEFVSSLADALFKSYHNPLNQSPLYASLNGRHLFDGSFQDLDLFVRCGFVTRYVPEPARTTVDKMGYMVLTEKAEHWYHALEEEGYFAAQHRSTSA
ncbi:MAG: hypothetical protein V1743_04550 [Nanoarchaeota archaeon]